MVFSSYEFLLLFLPIVVVGYYQSARLFPNNGPVLWLIGASFFFYGYWSIHFLVILIISCFINAGLGTCLMRKVPRARTMLIIGLAFNLGLLGYFKYWNFFISNTNAITGFSLPLQAIVLPIGISFFVFQKIAFLVDAYRGEVKDFSLLRFTLFVFFFPQLIAGPIVHHSELIPQFRHNFQQNMRLSNLALGLSILVIGLGKKVLIADGISEYSTPVFDAAAAGIQIRFLEAWCATVAYSLQLYFDFSGYSDMAIGLALMLGIHLPLNFNSPYKASSLIDFWRRWHMTLSRFLRDYVYFPLGGNRCSKLRQYINIFLVMLIGGIWHGAGWTFVVWGALHGTGLLINHGYRLLVSRKETATNEGTFTLSHLGTFLFVAVAWIPFRAANLDTALNVLRGICGLNGLILPDTYAVLLGHLTTWLTNNGVLFGKVYLFLGVSELGVLTALLLVVWFLPNTQQWFQYRGPGIQPNSPVLQAKRPIFIRLWHPSPAWALVLSIYAIACLLNTARGGEFLYFQF